MPIEPNWRTSSYTTQDSCVEVADNRPDAVMVRDTKHREHGVLCVEPAVWTDFIRYVRLQ
ncbi:DUF397 domain-containing protein [Streptomyces sp. V4I2]|uniref:DUF397 domain-containing protein n=1 Tax=Streptomyces sp. V4I2 TaxID=3042280 RepID=UPI0027878385|nr:DUF397 domain-containing protein [Streptomyces sp. V4I2]MDQ1041808.1 hypothetical protein [Streptomyces sp. V4I2]